MEFLISRFLVTVRMPISTAVEVLIGALKALPPAEREEVLRG